MSPPIRPKRRSRSSGEWIWRATTDLAKPGAAASTVAMIASGLHGIERELRLPAALEGNAYESRADRFPSTMRDAIDALERGMVARAAFGNQVVDHYLNYARTEQGLFDRHVTDWERKRYFERT